MKNHILATVVALLTCFASDLNARIVTLTIGGTKTNDSLFIGTNESFTILSGKATLSDAGWGPHLVCVKKDGLQQDSPLAEYDAASVGPSRYPYRHVVAGPATLSIVGVGLQLSFLTVEVLPDLYPPDKALVLPQGDGANIILESSTNLVHWSPAPLGSYTNKTANLFFRIRAERSQ